MRKLSNPTVLLLLFAALSISSYATYRYCREQAKLVVLLQQLDYLLILKNKDAITNAGYVIKGMEAAVMKNQNQPRGLAVIRQAKALEASFSALRATLRSCRGQLRNASGNPVAPALLQYPDQPGTAAYLLGNGSHTRLVLRQQVAACDSMMQQLGPPHAARLLVPVFERCAVSESLAALSLLESQVLAHELATFKYMAKPLGAPQIPIRFIAVATAETNAVAPGSKYRGSLMLIKSLSAVKMNMYCNGRPVAVGPDGVGTVQFRAPAKPGPAAWRAAIRFKINGRDTTFQVRAPYRIAHR